MKIDYIIFTDASVKRCGVKKSYAGYAAVILDVHTHKYSVISGELSGNTVPFCEAWAVLRGLHAVASVDTEHKKILIVSDSKVTVDALSKWIQHSWDLSDYLHWKKRDNKPVQNQHVYRKILKVIGKSNSKVRIVHIRSHSDKKHGIRDQIRKELRANKIRLNDKTLDLFIKMNQLADDTANLKADESREMSDLFIRLERRKEKEL